MLGTLVGRVFGVGGLATLLLEIAAAAALVAAYGGLGRGRLSGPRRQIGGRV